MLDFTIFKDIAPSDLAHVGVTNANEFAQWFANQIATETGCTVSGKEVDGQVHLFTDDSNMERVSDALEHRQLTHKF